MQKCKKKLFFGMLICNLAFINLVEMESSSENEEVTNEASTVSSTEETKQTTFEIPDDKWVTNALQDIAYYLRNYKFNEWDRRYKQEKPEDQLVGYYKDFSFPPLRSLHWKVYENCYENFHKCIIYLHSIIETSPLTKNDDTTTILNENLIPLNETLLKNIDEECKNAVSNAERSGLPFDGPIEKFQWRSTASYYMCWYTMLEIPALTMLGEPCDNFANCLDPVFGHQNKDPRADDKVSFACATYSFCPDPCCSAKHIKTFSDCYESDLNPCFAENSEREPKDKICSMHLKDNPNFRDIITNRWNISCHCNDEGFTWKSEFGLCVDINECITGAHSCDRQTQDCLNLPGNYRCICRWGYTLNKDNNTVCTKKIIFKESTFVLIEHFNSFRSFVNRIRQLFNFK